MKKIGFFSMVIVVLTLALVLVFPVSAESGTCGENIIWEYDQDISTLTITGQGEMDTGERAPWRNRGYLIRSIVVGEGITTIGESAFYGFDALRSVSLPSSLQMIGDLAFSDCVSITEVTIPAGVKTIGIGAFSHCFSLQQVNFSNGLKEIDNNAFLKCTALTSVTIPDSVTRLGTGAFATCQNLTSITLGRGITTLESALFSCSGLKKFVVPDWITKIEGGVFSSCTSLEEVHLGAGVSEIGSRVFEMSHKMKVITVSSENPYFLADKSVLYKKSNMELILMLESFSGEYTVLPGTTKIGYWACNNASGLTSIILPSSLTTIGESAFRYTGLTSIQLPNGLKTIGYQPFSETKISEITVPETVTEIGDCAFVGFSSLKKVVFTGPAPVISENAFSRCTLDVYYPGDKPGWSDAVKDYGGTLNWISTACTSHQPVTDPAKKPTCTESGLTEGSHCSVCQTVLMAQKTVPAKGHSYGKWSKIDAATHKHTCAECSLEETKNHTWDAGVETKKATCAVQGQRTYTCIGCGATKSEPVPVLTTHTYDHACDTACNICSFTRTITHSYSTTYSSSKDGHWLQCKFCGMKKDFEAHISGLPATEEQPQLCTACGYVLQPALRHTHSYEEEWSANEQAHWHVCDGCEEQSGYAAHDFSDDCDALCDTCGYTRETNHNYGAEWESDAANHWHSCTVCGAQEYTEKHIPDGEATETTAQLCVVCGYELAPATGMQTEPTETDPIETKSTGAEPTATEPTEDTRKPDDSKNVGGIVAVVIIAAAGIAGGGVFMWKKRKKH